MPRKAVNSSWQGFWGATARQWLPINDYDFSDNCEGMIRKVITPLYHRERVDFQVEPAKLRKSGEGITSSQANPSPACVVRSAHTPATSPDGRGERRAAFTLAETLITLMVIGVVAVLTLPSLMQNINDYTLQKQKDVFSKKWAEGLRRMRADNALDGTYTTATFVEKMKGYFAISTVCEPNNLESCFGKTITSYESSAEGDVFDVKDLKSAKNFNSNYESSDVYGLKFADGTNMLISYIPDCKGATDSDLKTSTTKCLLYMYDVNSSKSPNSYGGNTGATAKDGDDDMSDDKRNQINKGRDMIGNLSLSKGNLFGLSFELSSNGGVYLNNQYDNSKYSEAEEYCKSIDEKGGGWRPATLNELIELAKAVSNEAKCTYDIQQNSYSNCDSSYNMTFRESSLWLAILGLSEYTSGMFCSDDRTKSMYIDHYAGNLVEEGSSGFCELVLCVR